jgi:HprK-related kinase A
MPRLNHLSKSELGETLAEGALKLHIGPYIYQVKSNLDTIQHGLETLYGDFNIAPDNAFVDFNIALTQKGLSQKIQKRAQFLFDHQSPFDSISITQAYAFLEWGMNWCISVHQNEYLKLHAAVVAKNQIGVVMPGVPGAGKSTLCAALGLSGWRVLSDEHALIPPRSTDLIPLCRPISLKNESIQAIKNFSSAAVFGPVSKNTHKGVVAHIKADLTADSHNEKAVPAKIMVFPRYSAEEPQQLLPRQRATSFMLAAFHSFNYSLLGADGFSSMEQLIDEVECFDLTYHDLDWAVFTMEELLK